MEIQLGIPRIYEKKMNLSMAFTINLDWKSREDQNKLASAMEGKSIFGKAY